MLIYYLYKINNRLVKYLNKIKWFFLIKSIGKKSYIKNGVRIRPNPKAVKIGSGFIISENCFISVGKKSSITIGNNGLIGVGSYINCAEGNLYIGDNVAIAPSCKIFTYSHHYETQRNVTDSFKVADVKIEDNVLIGANVVILPGVTIKKGAIIAAGSVVVQNVEPNEIVGGLPAKFIKMRC